MKIETKFNIEDNVWFMKDNRPLEVNISAIKVSRIGGNKTTIQYNARDIVGSVSWLDHEHLFEYKVFKSKNDLLKSLFERTADMCKGENCSAVNGVNHSSECLAEHHKTIGL